MCCVKMQTNTEKYEKVKTKPNSTSNSKVSIVNIYENRFLE